MSDLLEPLAAAAEQSEFLRAVRSVREDSGRTLALGGETVRSLRMNEVRELVANGNTADGWHRVLVVEGFRSSRIRNSDFRGDVLLGRFEATVRGPDGVELPSGIYRSAVSNCAIGHDAVVRNVDLLSGYVVGERAWVADCGRVVCEGLTTFGNGTRIPIGPQSGGRWLPAFAEITLDIADALTGSQREGRLADRYPELLARYLAEAGSERGVISAAAIVAHTPVVRNVFVGTAAVIDAATRIENATLLSSVDEPVQLRDGVCVSDSMLQWGSRITGPAVVERSILMEHATVERFGKVADSVIGPNSAIGGAEVTASLVGPFVGCHHQGLLIAARWPGGRGNLGYGAGVGCNHTSRAPDQEGVLGEGLFVGLGATVKYPVDLSHSPYSILACGLTLPPQRIAFPFSLVREADAPIPGVHPGANVLIPGWMLMENLYAIQRCAMKFRSRDRARRHRLAHEVFRPDIMEFVDNACRRLEKCDGRREVYTERDIPGLGRNVLFERDRMAAVRCYTAHLERYRLLCALERATAGEWPQFDPKWQQAVAELDSLPKRLDEFGRAVERSKAQDEERGQRVIEDYADAHVATRDDPVLRQTWDEIEAAKRLVQVLAGFEPRAVPVCVDVGAEHVPLL